MMYSQTNMTLESRDPCCCTECVLCDAILLAYCRSSNYNPIAVANESYHDGRIIDHSDWQGTDILQSPVFPLGWVPNPIAVLEESYGYYDTDTGLSRLQDDLFEQSFDLSLSVPLYTQGLQSLDMGHLDYTLDTQSMMTPELYTPFPSGENAMDLNEASIENSGCYTDGGIYGSQAISFPFSPLPSGMLAYEDYGSPHGSIQVLGQTPTSDPCLEEETLDITDILDLQAYYYDMEARPLQKSNAESRHTWSTDETITSEETLEVIPTTLRRSQRLIERSRAA